MNLRRWLIIVAAAITLIGVGVAGYLYWQNKQEEQAQADAIAAAKQMRVDFFQSNTAKLVYALPTTADDSRVPAYSFLVHEIIADSNAAQLERFIGTNGVVSTPYITDAGELQWYRLDNTTLSLHTNESSEQVHTTSYTVANTKPAAGIGLQYHRPSNQLAWVTTMDDAPAIVVLNTETNEERVIATGAVDATWDSLTWSPDGNELAFVTNRGDIEMRTLEGAEVHTPIFASTGGDVNDMFKSVQWITTYELAAVRSYADNEQAPNLIIASPDGEIKEQHMFVDRIGTPYVAWDATGTYFSYVNPWLNRVVISDRFDVVQATYANPAAGGAQPIAMFEGTLPPRSDFDVSIFDAVQDTVSTISDVTNSTTDAPAEFTLTANQWDSLNEAIRMILRQFDVDMDTYRFSTDTSGLRVSVSMNSSQTKPAQVFLQTILQTQYVAKLIAEQTPAMSLEMHFGDELTYQIDDITYADVDALMQLQSTVDLGVNAFSDAATSAIGVPTTKPEATNQTYFGDLLYTTSGEYNPWVSFARLGILQTTPTQTINAYVTDAFTLYKPETWQVKTIETNVSEADNIILYPPTTRFISDVAWDGLAVEIRTYAIPEDITLDQWLQVNRLDQTFSVYEQTQAGIEGRNMMTERKHEVVLRTQDMVYSITLENNQALTEQDEQALTDIVGYFSNTALMNR